ncbi:MAG: hypothetical protein MRY83_22345 [Flavobacteriales bacterium]|nr:hypothetical protein [Flavobacteriales bacterium]
MRPSLLIFSFILFLFYSCSNVEKDSSPNLYHNLIAFEALLENFPDSAAVVLKKDSSKSICYFINRATYLSYDYRENEGISLLDSIISNKNYTHQESRALRMKKALFLAREDLEDSNTLIESCLNELGPTTDSSEIIFAMYKRARINAAQPSGKPLNTIKLARKALERTPSKDSVIIWNLNMLIATAYGDIGMLDSCLKFSLNATKSVSNDHYPIYVSGSSTLLGDVFFQKKQYNNALRHLKNALLSNDQLHLSGVHINIAYCAAELNDLSLMKEHLSKAEAIVSKSKSKYLKSLLNIALSRYYTKSKMPEEAISFAKKSEEINKANKDSIGLCYDYIELGKLYLDQKLFDKANLYLSKALSIAQNVGSLREIVPIKESIFKMEKSKGNYKLAVNIYEDLELLKDSITQLESVEYTQNLVTAYNDDLHNIRMAKKQEEIVSIKQKSRIKDLMIIISFFAIAIIITIGIIIRLKAKERLIKQQQRIKEQELTTQNLKQEVLAKTNIIKQKNQLIERISDSSEEFRSNITDKLDLDKDWMQFMAEFELLYPSFISNLDQHFSGMTNTDKKVSALIKLGLSNKEIANLMSITENGAKKAKQRLKSKLSQETSSLTDLITSI